MEIQWPLIVFTLCITLSAGLFGGLGLLGLLKKQLSQATSKMVLITAAVVLVVGGAASFLHLQHWDRAFNGFGSITSGITHELIGAVLFLILLAVAFAQLGRREQLPSWMNVTALLLSLVFVIVLANSYYMPSRPVWASFALYLYYLAQALLLGSIGLWLFCAVRKEQCASTLSRWTAATAVLQLVVLAIYVVVISGTASQFPQWGGYFDWTDPNRPATDFNLLGKLLSGEAAPWFWGGAVVAGAAVPALLGFLKPGKGQGQGQSQGQGGLALASLAVLCALAGGICFRAVLYILGNTVVPF